MHVEWHGQSAFTLTAPEATVFIDPFGDMKPAKRGLAPRWVVPMHYRTTAPTSSRVRRSSQA